MRAFLASLTSQMKEDKEAPRQKDEEQRQRDVKRDQVIQGLMAQLQEARSTHTITTTEKRTRVAIPALSTEKDLELWEAQFRASLAPGNLFQYLESDIPEPEDKTSVEWRQWKTDRQDIFKLLTASIKKATVMSRMTRIGWKPDDVDPRKLYLKAFETLQHGTEETARVLSHEYFTMTRRNSTAWMRISRASVSSDNACGPLV